MCAAYAILVLYRVIPPHWNWCAYNWLYDVCSGSACRQFRRATSTACNHHQTSSRASQTRTCASSSAKASTRTAPWGLCTLPRTTCSWHATFSSSSVGVDRRPCVARHSTRARNSSISSSCTAGHPDLSALAVTCPANFSAKLILCQQIFFCIFSLLVMVICSFLYLALSSSGPSWNGRQQVLPVCVNR